MVMGTASIAQVPADIAEKVRAATALIEGVWQTEKRCPSSVELKNSHHFSEGMAVGTADQQLTGPLLRWIKALPDKR